MGTAQYSYNPTYVQVEFAKLVALCLTNIHIRTRYSQLYVGLQTAFLGLPVRKNEQLARVSGECDVGIIPVHCQQHTQYI